MTPKALDQFRAALVSLKAELEQSEATAGDSAHTVELDQARVGRLSRMDAMQAQQMALETGRRRQRQLTKVEGALNRIESGEFGACFKCGEAIDLRRLKADPTHTRCIKCAEE